MGPGVGIRYTQNLVGTQPDVCQQGGGGWCPANCHHCLNDHQRVKNIQLIWSRLTWDGACPPRWDLRPAQENMYSCHGVRGLLGFDHRAL